MKLSNQRPIREDGRVTRKYILECAGKCIAAKGFEKTTAKEICEVAGESQSAINYHFGSRDGMYKELLALCYNHLLNLDYMMDIERLEGNVLERIRKFQDMIIHNMLEEDSWEIRVWIREILTPSPFLKELLEDVGTPKRAFLLRMFSEYTGRSIRDPILYAVILGFFSPFAVLSLAINRDVDYTELIPKGIGRPDKGLMVEQMRKFSLAGLDAFKI